MAGQLLLVALVAAGVVALVARERRRREQLRRVLHEHVGRRVELWWAPPSHNVAIPTVASGVLERVDEATGVVHLGDMEFRRIAFSEDSAQALGWRRQGIPIRDLRALVAERRHRF